jgi:cyclopropane fatty-acyl-phospholipid synthase-like methyltransferase
VAAGYDRAARRYLAWSAGGPTRLMWLGRLLELLRDDSDVLELGCGAGEPVTRRLTERHRVTGVDVSAVQLELAARHAPTAQLIHADMTEVAFASSSFDAVVAFYAVTHVPRERHADLLARIFEWLRPGGIVLLTMGAGDEPGSVEEEWLGVPMYFSHFDAATNRSLVQRAGFRIVEAELLEDDEDGIPVRFLWVLARRPLPSAT